MMKHLVLASSATLLGLFATSLPVQAQDETAPLIKIETLGDGFYMLTGPGGNIGVSSGPDGLFVIDDKYAKNADEIITRLGEISDQPIRYVLNTHYHGDHAGGNATLKTTGATIVAHENVRARMGMTFDNQVFGGTVDATDPSLWPTLTYSDDATFYMNGQTIKAIHVSHAHTDGDSLIHFVEGDVLHMGDNYFNGIFPYIDVSSGGTLQGMIAAQTLALDKATDTTQIIPGHGPLATKADLKRSRDRLQDIYDRVNARIDDGADLETILSENILSDYSEFSSFIDEDKMVKTTYISITGQ